MEFLGIGPLELFFILVIALIVLGPNDMVKAGRTIGRFMRNIITSPTWKTVQQTSRDIRYLPNRLMREAGIEDLKDSLPKGEDIRREIGYEEMKKDVKEWEKDLSDWTTPPPAIQTPEEFPSISEEIPEETQSEQEVDKD